VYNFSYPFSVDSSGGLSKTADVADKIKMLFDFPSGQRLLYDGYGVDLEPLLQSTFEIQEILPFVLIDIRKAVEKYIPEIVVKYIAGYKEARTLVIQVVYAKIETEDVVEEWSWKQENVFNM